MKLIIDIGNTRIKLAVFSGVKMEQLFLSETLTVEMLAGIMKKFPGIRSAVLSAVKDYTPDIDDFLRQKVYFLKLDNETPLPVKILYKTPQTLGKDRIAIAAASRAMFPGQNVLAVDAGTTITYDFVNKKGEYLGGGISPGIRMRLKALHVFTGKLPQVKGPYADVKLIGNDTRGAILSGVLNGVVAEVEGILSAYLKEIPDIKIVLSGGDEKYFDKRLKNNIFAVPNFVIKGLWEILKFNEEKREDEE